MIFFGTSKTTITSKTFFSSRPFILFLFDSTNCIGVRKSKKSFSYQKVEIWTIFWYLIGVYYIQKDLVIGIEKVFVISKSKISDGKSWARNKISAVGG